MVSRDGLRSRLFFHGVPDVDQVIGDDAEANPAVHADIALVAAAVKAVSPFCDADAALTTGAPRNRANGRILR